MVSIDPSMTLPHESEDSIKYDALLLKNNTNYTSDGDKVMQTNVETPELTAPTTDDTISINILDRYKTIEEKRMFLKQIDERSINLSSLMNEETLLGISKIQSEVIKFDLERTHHNDNDKTESSANPSEKEPISSTKTEETANTIINTKDVKEVSDAQEETQTDAENEKNGIKILINFVI